MERLAILDYIIGAVAIIMVIYTAVSVWATFFSVGLFASPYLIEPFLPAPVQQEDQHKLPIQLRK